MDTNPHNPGGYAVTLRKYRSTWYWTTHNPQGGSFGSNLCGAKATAYKYATMNIPAGVPFVVITENEGRHVSTITTTKEAR